MNESEVLAACERFELGRLPRRAWGQVGNRSGVGFGASVEFFDFRPYAPGDDLRHVDWAAYARTGELTVRRFRAEVQPRIDVLVDASRSMGIDDGRKPTLARELAAFFSQSASSGGGRGRVHRLGRGVEPVLRLPDLQFNDPSSAIFAGGSPLELPDFGLRVVISDFMNPRVPSAYLKRLGDRAALLVVIQLLGPWETNPEEGDLWHLTDAESGHGFAAGISRQLRLRYLEKLTLIREELRATCAAVGGSFVPVCADDSLSGILKRDFAPPELVVPR